MKNSISIKFDENVVRYLEQKKRNTLTLTINISGGGCCPTIEVADIDFSPPEECDDYNKFNCENINVYISKKAKIITPVLRFKLEKNLFFCRIVPIGLNLKGH